MLRTKTKALGVFIIGLTGCGDSGGGNSTFENDSPEGLWTSECQVLASGASWLTNLEFTSEKKMSWLFSLHSSDDCDDQNIDLVITGEGSWTLPSSAEETRAIDLDFAKLQGTLKNENFLSDRPAGDLCGFDAWQENETRSLFGKRCDLLDEEQVFPQQFEVVPDVFENVETAIRFGKKDLFFPQTRPTDLSDLYYRRVQQADTAAWGGLF